MLAIKTYLRLTLEWIRRIFLWISLLPTNSSFKRLFGLIRAVNVPQWSHPRRSPAVIVEVEINRFSNRGPPFVVITDVSQRSGPGTISGIVASRSFVSGRKELLGDGLQGAGPRVIVVLHRLRVKTLLRLLLLLSLRWTDMIHFAGISIHWRRGRSGGLLLLRLFRLSSLLLLWLTLLLRLKNFGKGFHGRNFGLFNFFQL